MDKELIIALDFSSKEEVHHFLQPFKGKSLFVKVGMELFYQEGPEIIHYLKNEGHRIFLDLKLHDIPHTVCQAMKGLAKLNVDLVNVHAAGGKRMMEAAIEGLEAGTQSGFSRPSCIGVTQLTSTSSSMLKEELLIERDLDETVFHYGKLAFESGLDGVVCSVHEVKTIHEKISPSFLTVTPGIRLNEDRADDQVRVATPGYARSTGTSAIVVGRSITRAAEPFNAYLKVNDEWKGLKV
ncbi:orotidine-5'-phosphate decarboxylase [Bacillus sp. IB182487]|uniref:Orotidine 5'-phosphate decarboxylase n=1 Tax=Metabacillus arenae TaxID=2771434 RepID=A0A926NAT3_9BACI|nr:orotidine-5'-phosphate decarboxylase [Metabacillus arenae]